VRQADALKILLVAYMLMHPHQDYYKDKWNEFTMSDKRILQTLMRTAYETHPELIAALNPLTVDINNIEQRLTQLKPCFG
jgi:hypothetical protein